MYLGRIGRRGQRRDCQHCGLTWQRCGAAVVTLFPGIPQLRFDRVGQPVTIKSLRHIGPKFWAWEPGIADLRQVTE